MNLIQSNLQSYSTEQDTLQTYASNLQAITGEAVIGGIITSESDNQESLTVAYESQSDFDNSMINSLIDTGNVFAAMALANEINELNGYEVITGYHIRTVKNHYLKSKVENVNIKNENMKSEITKIKNVKRENEISKKQKVDSENAKCKYRELQKGYMKMMSR